MFATIFFIFLFIGLLALMVLLAKAISGFRISKPSTEFTMAVTVLARGNDFEGNNGKLPVTFKAESGDIVELRVPSKKADGIIEGEKGTLSFKGTKFLKFERI